MAQVSCPSCSKPIAEDATTCPKCGHPLPPGWAEKQRQQEKQAGICLLVVIVVAVVGWGIYSAISSVITDWREDPSTNKAWSYQVVSQEDHDGIRKKVIAYVYSDAPDFTSRAQTALKAAMEIERDSGANLTSVFMIPTPSKVFAGKGLYVAIAFYAKDGQGTGGTTPLAHGRWEAFANDVQTSPIRRKVLDIFEETVDSHPILSVSCTDRGTAEKGKKRWATALGASYKEFEDWQIVSGAAIPRC